MKIEKEFMDLILEAPEGQLDPSLIPYIEAWNSEPSAFDILTLLDKMVYGCLASEFTILLFEELLRQAVTEEDTTIDEIFKLRKANESLR